MSNCARQLHARKPPMRLTGLRGGVAVRRSLWVTGQTYLLMCPINKRAQIAIGRDRRYVRSNKNTDEEGKHAMSISAFRRTEMEPYADNTFIVVLWNSGTTKQNGLA